MAASYKTLTLNTDQRMSRRPTTALQLDLASTTRSDDHQIMARIAAAKSPLSFIISTSDNIDTETGISAADVAARTGKLRLHF